MGWTTVYIRGKSGFEGDVLNSLEDSGYKFMRGYSNEKGLMLYWISEKEDLRSFKKAIGAKIIFKYRLRFFTNIEDFVESKHNAQKSEIENAKIIGRELSSLFEIPHP